MSNYGIDLKLYEDCLFDIKQRLSVIRNHVDGKVSEKYLIVEVEIVCLQFRKILEEIALLSLIANKEKYSEQHDKFTRHYHAERIMNDLEGINPDFYPRPVYTVESPNGMIEWRNIESGYLTKDELVKIYEKCGGMMHAKNPYANQWTAEQLKGIQSRFIEWHNKIITLLDSHIISLYGGDIKVAALMTRSDNNMPQAVIFVREDMMKSINA